jgi:hypothetical protein
MRRLSSNLGATAEVQRQPLEILEKWNAGLETSFSGRGVSTFSRRFGLIGFTGPQHHDTKTSVSFSRPSFVLSGYFRIAFFKGSP